MITNRPARRRALERLGTKIEITHFTHEGSLDKYGDATGFTETTETSYAVYGPSQRSEQVGGMEGADLTDEVRFYIMDDINIQVGGDEETVKADLIHVPATNRTYKPFEAIPADTGTQRVLARDVDL